MATGTPPPDRAMRLVLPTGIGSTSAPTDATHTKPGHRKGERYDWGIAEPHYRAGIMTDREVAATIGCSHTALQKHAKDNGWERDLNARIQVRADAKVAKATVAKEVAAGNLAANVTLVEGMAEAVMRVKMDQRAGMSRARALALRLFGELETQVIERPTLIKLVEEAILEGSVGELAGGALFKMLDFPGNVKALADLVATMKTITDMERTAFKLDTYVDPGSKTGRESIPIQFIEPPHRPDGEDD